MMGMVYKDFLVMRKQLSYYLALMAVYAVLAAADIFPPFILPGIVVLVGMMLPMSTIAYDDQARWDKFAVSTPAGRGGVVGAKYLFAVITLTVGSALVLALMAILVAAGLFSVTFTESLFAVAACLLVGLFFDAVILPILIKFGAEKSRIISIVLFVGVFGGSMLIAQLAKSGNFDLSAPPAWLLNALPVVLALVCIGAFVISYFISLGIYGKKEL